jgi:hypothetical protein
MQLDAAAAWPVRVIARETDGPVWRANLVGTRKTYGVVRELHLCCAECGQSVLCLSPDIWGEPYRTTAAAVSAGILRHLRLSHPGVVAS